MDESYSLAFDGRPRTALQYAEGPVRDDLEGKTFEVRGWHRWSNRRKLRYLRKIAERYGTDARFRHFVITDVLRGVPDRDYRGQATAILSWVQSQIRYVNEKDEILQSPWQTIKLGYGDCDDKAILVAAMADTIALPWRYVLAGKTPRGQLVRWVEGTPAPAWNANYVHIYNLLGWPPFHPTEWELAEPTADVPLGFDIVENGGRLPELGSSMSGAFGAFGRTDATPEIVVRHSANVEWFHGLPWDEIIIGIIQGVATALVVSALMKRGK